MKKTIVTKSNLVGFNYAALAPEARDLAESAAGKIQELQASMARSVVAIGRLLLAVQRSLGKKTFNAWRATETALSQTMISNYMSAARTFADADNLERVSASALIELARERVPPAVRGEALQRANAGDTVTRTTVMELVAAHQLETEGECEAAIAPDARQVRNIRASMRAAIRSFPADSQRLVANKLAVAVREAFEELGYPEAFDLAAARSGPSRIAAPLGAAALATSLAIGAPVLT